MSILSMLKYLTFIESSLDRVEVVSFVCPNDKQGRLVKDSSNIYLNIFMHSKSKKKRLSNF